MSVPPSVSLSRLFHLGEGPDEAVLYSHTETHKEYDGCLQSERFVNYTLEHLLRCLISHFRSYQVHK